MSSRQAAASGWRASAVSAEDQTPSGQCFMAADGQIYWQPTPQHNPSSRGYNQGPGPRLSDYEAQRSHHEGGYSSSAMPQQHTKSRQQLSQPGAMGYGPAYDNRYMARPPPPTARMRASEQVLRESDECSAGSERQVPTVTPPRSMKAKEAPDMRQVAAKPVDSAQSAQQPSAEAEPPDRKQSIMLFLACSVAFIAVALAVILVYTFGNPGATRRLKSPRFCGDVPSWRTSKLKSEFTKCSEETCSRTVCGPINDTWCLTGAPPFDSKCECCDWCIVRELVCGKRARASNPNPYATCQASCGRL